MAVKIAKKLIRIMRRNPPIDNRIVGMIEFNGKVMIATEKHIFDITEKDNRKVIFSVDAADEIVKGKSYTMTEATNG